jgi:hypothetical protein
MGGPFMPALCSGRSLCMRGAAGSTGVPTGAVVRTPGFGAARGGPKPPRAVFSSSFIVLPGRVVP